MVCAPQICVYNCLRYVTHTSLRNNCFVRITFHETVKPLKEAENRAHQNIRVLVLLVRFSLRTIPFRRSFALSCLCTDHHVNTVQPQCGYNGKVPRPHSLQVQSEVLQRILSKQHLWRRTSPFHMLSVPQPLCFRKPPSLPGLPLLTSQASCSWCMRSSICAAWLAAARKAA